MFWKRRIFPKGIIGEENDVLPLCRYFSSRGRLGSPTGVMRI